MLLSDQVHAVATCAVVVGMSSEFTVYAYNWSILNVHKIYSDHKRSIKIAQDIQEF